MSLSNDLISQLVKATTGNKKTETETIMHATVKSKEGSSGLYVQIDGSDQLTPISTTADAQPGERVTVTIKNHTAMITGNISSPSARTDSVKEVGTKISEFEIIVAYKISTEDFEAVNATIESLKAVTARIDTADIETLEAVNAKIESLEARFIEGESITTDELKAITAEIESLEATFGTFTDISTEDLEAANASIGQLKGYTADFTYVLADELEATHAKIDDLDAKKLSAEEAEIKYANIDFSNIGEAAVKKIFSESGIIEDLVVSDGKITGELVGVTIKGDLIEGNTIKADKLVVKGSDGLYYKLNIEGGATTSEQVTDEDLQNGLSGSIIVAKSITAEKVAVDDLVAFGATIGGFHITDSSLYSGVKSSVGNTTRGVYLDNDGQVAFGDSDNFVKFYKDTDGNYKLAISASSMRFASTGKTVEETIAETEEKIDNIQIGARNLIRNSQNLIFDDYYFADGTETSILGVAQLGLLTLGAEANANDNGVSEASESETASASDDYNLQGFVDGMRLHDYHLIAMENAIIKSLGGVPAARITTVHLSSGGWSGSNSVYSQIVAVDGITANSKIDLLPSPEQLNELLLSEISLTAANGSGTITVFALGNMPANDLDLQAMVTEVIIPGVNT